jgi:pyruvate kinase
LSRHQQTLNWCALYRGVTPVYFDGDETQPVIQTCRDAINELKSRGHLKSGDLILMTYGDKIETIGGTNTCKMMIVE